MTKYDNEYKERLVNLGIEVKVIPNLTICCCIIDKSTVWYGDVNILGYAIAQDNIIKFEDNKLANELLGMLG